MDDLTSDDVRVASARASDSVGGKCERGGRGDRGERSGEGDHASCEGFFMAVSFVR